MLSFPSAVRIFLAVEPVDMRKSFDGLYAVAANQLKENPLQGGMFVFSNRRRNRLKILFFGPRASYAASGKLRLKSEALSMLRAGSNSRTA